MFLDGLRAMNANGEIIYVAAQNAPGGQASGASTQNGGGGRLAAVVARRGMARERNRVRRTRERPPMLATARQDASGRFRRPKDGAGVAQGESKLIREVFIDSGIGFGNLGCE